MSHLGDDRPVERVRFSDEHGSLVRWGVGTSEPHVLRKEHLIDLLRRFSLEWISTDPFSTRFSTRHLYQQSSTFSGEGSISDWANFATPLKNWPIISLAAAPMMR